MKKKIYSIYIEEEDGFLDRLCYTNSKEKMEEAVLKLSNEEKGDITCLLVEEIEVEVINLTSPEESAVKKTA